jgi:hypothetical protein
MAYLMGIHGSSYKPVGLVLCGDDTQAAVLVTAAIGVACLGEMRSAVILTASHFENT